MASRGVNKVILVGNLGNDPDVRQMPNGETVTNISVATSETWKDKQTGDPREQTEWHRVVMFRRLGEIAGQYLKKGSKVYLEGRLQTRKWQAPDGSDRYSTEIVANEMQMLDSRSGGTSDYSGAGGQPAQNSYAAPQQANPGPSASPGQAPSAPMDDFDDDIPF